jgi:hypothetical protein
MCTEIPLWPFWVQAFGGLAVTTPMACPTAVPVAQAAGAMNGVATAISSANTTRRILCLFTRPDAISVLMQFLTDSETRHCGEISDYKSMLNSRGCPIGA